MPFINPYRKRKNYKKIFETALESYLGWMARTLIWWHDPFVIGITGSVGKTSVRETTYAILSTKRRVERGIPEKNYNNQIGVPLVIIGAKHHGKNIFGWLGVFFVFLYRLISDTYPDTLILEMGIDRPGDMDVLTSYARPMIGILTGVGPVPVHVEYFKDPEEVILEKEKLLLAIKSQGYSIINADDPQLIYSRERHVATLSYGFCEEADVRVEDFHMIFSADSTTARRGSYFNISYRGTLLPIVLPDVFGRAQALAVAAAFAVGVLSHIEPEDMATALLSYSTPPGRLRLIPGKNQTSILDDTYNAAPGAVEAALETLRVTPGARKIAVLGDMLELGVYSEEMHRMIGAMIPGLADILITVGTRSLMIQDQALKGGLNHANTHHFENSREVSKTLLPMMRAGDYILVKGGQSMRMERVVEEVMAEPTKARELLPRQSVDWKARA